MVSSWWLLFALLVGAAGGFLLFALVSIASRDGDDNSAARDTHRLTS
jgi:hypothetical protein